MPKSWEGLTGVDVTSGTAEDRDGDGFHGFVTVRATATDGSFMSGQLSPADLRKMALNFLSVAEAAEQDAIVMMMLTHDVGLDAETSAVFIMQMREVRHTLHPDEDDMPDS
jgi:hypothetical protein